MVDRVGPLVPARSRVGAGGAPTLTFVSIPARGTRPIGALSCAVALLLLASCAAKNDRAGDGSAPTGVTTGSTATPTTVTAPPPELPGGGREIFPARRVVAYYGNPTTPLLGVLGDAGPTETAAHVLAAAAPFAEPGRSVLGAFEMIVSVAQAAPGPDGDYSEPTETAVIQPWLEAARAHGLLLVLDVQPGRARFPDEVKRYEALLREPDVGLALDAEWRMDPGEVPGKTVGHVSAAEVNEVSAWLAAIVAEANLPEKLFVLHQFTRSMIPDREAVVDRAGLATVVHLDGFGTPRVKLAKYEELHAEAPFANGFKLFYDDDIDLLTPTEVLALVPAPDLITYQ